MTSQNGSRHIKVRIPQILQQVFLFLAVSWSSAALAQQWTFDPILRVAAERDDNAQLDIRTDQEISLEGFLAEASVDIDYASALTSFTLSPRILSRNYSSNAEFDSDDIFLRTAFRRNMQSSSLGFRVNLDQQSVRTAERAEADFDIENPDEIPDDDSGRVALTGERTRIRLMPNWSYRFSDVNSVAADINYFDVDYSDVFLDRLSDYKDGRANLFFRHAYSDVNTGVIAATTRKYETGDGLSEASGYGLQAGFQRSISEKTKLEAMIGVEISDSAVGTGNESTVVGNITLSRNLETIRMLAQYRRLVNATGAGRLSTRDSINLNFTRKLSDRISAGVGARAYQSRGLGQSSQADDRDYVQLRSQFSWYLSRQLTVEIDYRFTMLNRLNVGERANSNQVGIWFSYQPNRIPE